MEPYFKPWTSDEEPKPPEGWGLSAIYVDNKVLRCDTCHNTLRIREQYIYRFTKEGPVVYHNTKECCASIIN